MCAGLIKIRTSIKPGNLTFGKALLSDQIETTTANIIKRHSEFSSEHLRFELLLVGRKISSADTEILSRLEGQLSKGDLGLVSDDAKMKRYVMNWYTLLDSFELSHSHLLDVLKLKRESLTEWTKDQLVEDLQTEQS